MSNTHTATIHWEQPSAPNFIKGQFTREHTWTFDGGVVVPASPSPSLVPLPWSNAAGVDPEEAFVAALSSCHLLVFLYVASRQGFQVVSYHDEAIGEMGKNERGGVWVAKVTLRPVVKYAGEKLPTPEQEAQLHHVAHEQCFIANSVKTAVTVEPASA
jgi:organic hydroperoxide reductase OsmC/OhrA